MTPSDDEIRAARIALDLPVDVALFDREVRALYRAAFAAGVEAAAVICEQFQGERGERYAEIVRTRDEPQRAAMALDMAYAAMRCADAIRAAKP